MRLSRMTTQECNARLALIAMDAKMVAIDIAMLAAAMRLKPLQVERPQASRSKRHAT